MQVAYTIDPIYDSRKLEVVFGNAIKAGFSNVLVYLPAFSSLSYLDAMTCLTFQGNNHFKYSSLSGDIVTKRTVKQYKQPVDLAIAVGMATNDLSVFEDKLNAKVVVVINNTMANVEKWLKLYDAIDLQTGDSIMTGMLIAPLLNRTIGWLKSLSVGGTPLYDFKMDDYLREAANLLKRNNVTYKVEEVSCQCIKRGLDARSARSVADVFEHSLLVNGDLKIKVGNPDYGVMLTMVDKSNYDNN